jgi:hypothetical protein
VAPFVAESTMAPRVSRPSVPWRAASWISPATGPLCCGCWTSPTPPATQGRVDLAKEAIRPARQLTLATDEPGALGLVGHVLRAAAGLPQATQRARGVAPLIWRARPPHPPGGASAGRCPASGELGGARRCEMLR